MNALTKIIVVLLVIYLVLIILCYLDTGFVSIENLFTCPIDSVKNLWIGWNR